jgi:hypothetical protein
MRIKKALPTVCFLPILLNISFFELRFRFHSHSSMTDPASVKPSPKHRYFEDWNVDQQPSYCILSHLPAGPNPLDITVEITPETDCVTFDPTTATLLLRGVEKWVDCIVRMHEHGPFTLHDSFMISHKTAAPQNDKSIFECPSEKEWKQRCEREGGLCLGTTVSLTMIVVPGSFSSWRHGDSVR